MDATDLPKQPIARARLHTLTCLTGGLAAVGAAALVRVLAGPDFGAVGFAAALVVFLAVAIGATLRFARCPACDESVAMQMSGRASFVSSRYALTCRHCGKTIFDGRFTREVRVVQLGVFVGTILLFGSLYWFQR